LRTQRYVACAAISLPATFRRQVVPCPSSLATRTHSHPSACSIPVSAASRAARTRARAAGEDFLYLGDTARLPYGHQEPESIRRYALQAAALLRDRGVKCLVVACNTASAVALDGLAAEFAPVPCSAWSSRVPRLPARPPHGRIAVVATESTVRGGAYQSAIHRCRPDATVEARACPLFVALAERLDRGRWSSGDPPLPRRPVCRRRSGAPRHAGAGLHALPGARPAIRKVLGAQVAIVDSAETTAAALVGVLDAAGLRRPAGAGGGRISCSPPTRRSGSPASAARSSAGRSRPPTSRSWTSSVVSLCAARGDRNEDRQRQHRAMIASDQVIGNLPPNAWLSHTIFRRRRSAPGRGRTSGSGTSAPRSRAGRTWRAGRGWRKCSR